MGEYMHEIIQVARPDAYKKLLQNMIAECREAFSRYREGKFWLENPDKWISDVKNNIHRLHHLVEGDAVKPEWVWQTMGVLRVQDVFMCVMIINPTYRLRMMTEDVCHRRSQ